MQKNDLRYSTKGILTVLFIISILGVLIGLYASKSEIFNLGSHYDDYYSYYVLVENSLYDHEKSQYVNYIKNDSEKFIDYHIRSYKISNYPFTEEYKANHSQVVLDVSSKTNKKYEYFKTYNEAVEYAKNMGIAVPKINTDITEEPNFNIYYLTSEYVSNEFDPQDISKKLIKDNNIVISGNWDGNNFNFINDIDKVSEEYRFYAKNLKQAIREVYNNINDVGINSLNFSYSINPSSTAFLNHKAALDFENNLFPSSAIGVAAALILIFVFGIISNYYNTKESKFYKAIVKVPFEVVFFIAIPAWVLYAVGSYEFFRTNIWAINKLHYLFYLLQIIAIFTMGIAILYTVFLLKDIFYRGFAAEVVQNSIITKILKFFGHKSKRLFSKSKEVSDEYIKEFDVGKRKYLVLVFIGLLILGAIACNVVVVMGLQLIVFVLWVCLLLFMFLKFQKYILELEDIEKTAKIISEGHYDIKISEENSQFKGLAHNLNAITNNLDNAISKAVKSERMKTDLIANVSHDLKTPLTSIINYSELIISENDTENIKKYSKVINEKSLKLKVLIEDLFEVSKVSSENIELDVEELDFQQLVKQIIGEWEDKLMEKNIQIVEKYSSENIILNLDGVKTSRILDNLFSNIYKYALEGTRVYLDIEKTDRVRLNIKNISKYPLNISADELMERFTRGDISRNTEGSGLGLSIAQSLVKIQKGDFQIEIDGDLFKSTIEF